MEEPIKGLQVVCLYSCQRFKTTEFKTGAVVFVHIVYESVKRTCISRLHWFLIADQNSHCEQSPDSVFIGQV